MPISSRKNSQILAALQNAARDQDLNPYRIAKMSGMPLTTVQRLLTISYTVPLRNVELLIDALGLDIQVVPREQIKAKPKAKASTKGSARSTKAARGR
jgi:hypothetical protein